LFFLSPLSLSSPEKHPSLPGTTRHPPPATTAAKWDRGHGSRSRAARKGRRRGVEKKKASEREKKRKSTRKEKERKRTKKLSRKRKKEKKGQRAVENVKKGDQVKRNIEHLSLAFKFGVGKKGGGARGRFLLERN
jgi:hypothetical protein